MKFDLAVTPPFNFESVVYSHGWYQLAPWEWNAETHELTRPELLASGRVALLTLSPSFNGVQIESSGRLKQAETREIAFKVAWMFSLDLDLAEFYELADNEPRLAHVRPNAHGRFLRSPTFWEDVVKVMMTTNIQWSGTKRLVHVLVAKFGQSVGNAPPTVGNARRSVPSRRLNETAFVQYKGRRSVAVPGRAFPTPHAIARTRESTLRKLGLGYRAPYLLQLARGVVKNQYDLESLRDPAIPTEQLRRALLALPGIGPYAAATLLTILGRYDFIGVDTEAISAVSKGFYGGKPVTAREIEIAFARWGKFKSLAYWFWDWAQPTDPPK